MQVNDAELNYIDVLLPRLSGGKEALLSWDSNVYVIVYIPLYTDMYTITRLFVTNDI